MSQIVEALKWAVEQYAKHREQVTLVGLVLALIVVSVAAKKVFKSGKVDQTVNALSFVAAFGFSMDGMWIVATQKANVPAEVAVAVFFVAEAFMVNSMRRGGRLYEATTVRDEAGKVIEWGTTGSHGKAVWIIATVAGSLAALSSHNPVEFVLRLALPLGAAYQWWTGLTGADVKRRRSRFAYSPARLAVRYGWWTPEAEADDEEARWSEERAARKRAKAVRALVTVGSRVRSGGASDKDRVRLAELALSSTAETRAAALLDLVDAEAFLAAMRASTDEQHSTPAQVSTEQHVLEASTPAQHSSTEVAVPERAEPVPVGARAERAGGQPPSVPVRSDAELLDVLRAEVDRRAGTGEQPLGFRAAMELVAASKERTKRLIGAAGLAQDAAGKVVRPVDGAAPVNGAEVPDLLGALG